MKGKNLSEYSRIATALSNLHKAGATLLLLRIKINQCFPSSIYESLVWLHTLISSYIYEGILCYNNTNKLYLNSHSLSN